ncbi:MAG: NUDIX hydrolase [Candidatus Omnitrophica bacterium]|nr:NUDIX hydrolase [Candidatus Omnitrophota bacterium]
MTQEIFKYLRKEVHPSLKKIIFVLYGQDGFKIFERNVSGYIEHLFKKVSQGPFLTVDGIVEFESGIVLIERLNPPLGWALPGGFVDEGETVEESVVREIKEETSLDLVDFRQFGVYSDPSRDARFHTVSVVFAGKAKGSLKAASDAKNAKVFSLDSLPNEIAFDHRKIIEDYIDSRRL